MKIRKTWVVIVTREFETDLKTYQGVTDKDGEQFEVRTATDVARWEREKSEEDQWYELTDECGQNSDDKIVTYVEILDGEDGFVVDEDLNPHPKERMTDQWADVIKVDSTS
jgi:hypothetical protein